MKKSLSLFLVMFSILTISVTANASVIEGGVSLTDKVPQEFFGNWRVESKCVKSTNKEMFGGEGVDIWVLTRKGDTINLKNPFTGAQAEITVDDVKGKTVKFEKSSYYPGEESYETPILTVNGDTFTGTDKIVIKTFEQGKLIKEDYVEFKVKGTKISGRNLHDIFGI